MEKFELNYLRSSITFIIVLFIFNTSFAEDSSKCKEIKNKKIEIEEIISPDQSIRKLKKELLDEALMEAVKETVGVKIKSYEGIHLEENNENTNDSYKNLTSAKTKGLIQSYEVEQQIVSQGNLNILKLTVFARICIPKEEFNKDTVAIGNFSFENNESYNPARDLLASIFPTDNTKYYLANGHAKNVYHDILISGMAKVYSSESSKLEAKEN